MILVTGAGGFVGSGLVERLLATGEALTLVDMQGLAAWANHPGVTCVAGSIADAAVLARAVAGRPRTVFHLASVPGGRAEQDYALGRTVNLDATAALLELLAATGVAPVLVFASSIAVFGGPLPDPCPSASRPARSCPTARTSWSARCWSPISPGAAGWMAARCGCPAS